MSLKDKTKLPLDRCEWCEGSELYIKYHDTEWGVPVFKDTIHFEFLLLESMQAGLSWFTILKKRDSFRKAFDEFDYHKIAKYEEEKINELMNNKGVIRHRKKIVSAINNARRFIEIETEYGSFNSYIWRFTEGKTIVNHYEEINEVPSKSALSVSISSDLKKRGFKFLGSVTVYSYLQAVGIIDDHVDTCFRKKLNIRSQREL